MPTASSRRLIVAVLFDISRGSALECAAALDVVVAKGRCEMGMVAPGANVGKITSLAGQTE
jgi:hypothetical protein